MCTKRQSVPPYIYFTKNRGMLNLPVYTCDIHIRCIDPCISTYVLTRFVCIHISRPSHHMMAQSVLFIVIVAALLINIFRYCSAESVYCVTPTATSCSSCPYNSIHCATLSGYAQEAEMFFTSNATLVFLPGNHTLDRNITVANVARLTIYGTSSSDNIATVVRNGSVDFRFTNMVDFDIYSLGFTSYRFWSYGSLLASNSALLLQYITYVELVSCSFHDNLGSGLTVHNTNITLTNIKFTCNHCGCKSFSESFSEGCRLGCQLSLLSTATCHLLGTLLSSTIVCATT